jgi:hypothetical protein
MRVVRLALGGLGTVALALSLQAITSPAARASDIMNLPLINGWTNAPFGTSDAGFTTISGIVTLKGAIATAGTNPVPFVLPLAVRPTTNVFVPVDLCNATNGRLAIAPSGSVVVEQENGTPFSNAQCFTSLEGASFSVTTNGYTPLTLVNGWTNAPFGTSNAAARTIRGIVHFKGAIASGSTAVVSTLPPGLRPSTDVYVPVDLCNATNGRLHITPSGAVDIETDTATPFSNAQCFTSLDGASFSLASAPVSPLTLQNGWTNAPFSTSNAVAANIDGLVHLKGAISNGSSASVFTLPGALRPSASVYVKVDLCGANNGRLFIQSNGAVSVQQESGTPFSNAQCFTSLDGVTFAATMFHPLGLTNGWTNTPFGTNRAAVMIAQNIVYLRGAIATPTTNTNASPFTLPAPYRPATTVFLPVDMCNATNGRLIIQPSGVVTLQPQQGTPFSNAQCFTSLEGVSYAPATNGFTPLTLQNGWTNAPFGTSNAEARTVGGFVHLKGAIASGTSAVTFTLPAGMRPARDVYVPVDLCDANNGRLHILPSGVTDVEEEGNVFANAQCFTSLDGATFATTAAPLTLLTLQNGWTNGPFSTSAASAASLAGLVHLAGAIATTGTSAVPFTLPADLRPTATVYVKVDLCGTSNGRLVITPSGAASVQQETGTPFSNAQCFTSLDGVEFAPGP